MTNSNQLVAWVILTTGVALAVVLGLWGTRDLAFDSARWNAPKQRSSWRLRMANWLVKKEFLLGKTRNEVVSILGAPSDAPWFNFSNWDLAFDLFECTLTLQSLALAIRFDEQGLVTECQVVSG
jgi:hypothetical protein